MCRATLNYIYADMEIKVLCVAHVETSHLLHTQNHEVKYLIKCNVVFAGSLLELYGCLNVAMTTYDEEMFYHPQRKATNWRILLPNQTILVYRIWTIYALELWWAEEALSRLCKEVLLIRVPDSLMGTLRLCISIVISILKARINTF